MGKYRLEDVQLARDLRRLRNTCDARLKELAIPEEELVIGRPLSRNKKAVVAAAPEPVLRAKPKRSGAK